MLNLLAYGALAFGIGTWLHTLWRARTSLITEKEKVDQNLLAAFFAYMGVGAFGFNFPLVEHTNTPIIGIVPALFWIAVISALPCAVALALYLRRFEQYRAVWIGILTFFMFLVFNGAHAMLFNGLADFRPAQKRITQVVGRRFQPRRGKSHPSYLLFLRDWNNPQMQVRFETDPALYNQTSNGDAIELDIKPGALGMEWIQDARRATF